MYICSLLLWRRLLPLLDYCFVVEGASQGLRLAWIDFGPCLVCVCVFVCACLRACVRACVRACERARVRAFVRVCVCAD